jgi:hypothetical protein
VIVVGIPDRFIGHIPYNHIPLGPIVPQGSRSIDIQLHGEGVVEASQFKPQCLTSRSRTDFNYLWV